MVPAGATTKADSAAEKSDPFLGRTSMAATNGATPASPASPTPPGLPEQDLAAALAKAGQQHATAQPDKPIDNPFSRRASEGVVPAQFEQSAPATPVETASWDQSIPSAPGAAARPAATGSPTSAEGNALWSLPNSPLPPASANANPQQAADPSGAAPPPRGIAAPASALQSPDPQAKQQTLAQLAEGRRALEAGDLQRAEALSRSAAALRVPESQFLPDEDRPSLLAWDIERAKQSAANERNLPARLPSTSAPVSIAAAETTGSPPSESTGPEELPLPAAEAGKPASLLDTADETQQVLARQLSAEVGKRQSEAQRLRSEDPERALAILREAQQLVNDSKLPESSRRELLSRIDITLEKTNKYIKDNAAQIELDRQNTAVLEERDRDRELKLKLQQKIADQVEEFNRLRDEQRYAEAEVVAQRLYELAPDDPVAEQVRQTAKFIRREMINRQLADSREEGIWDALNDVEQSSVSNVGDGRELVYDQKHWDQFVQNRKGTKDRIQRRTERELDIERRMKTPVMLRYENTPLSEVMDGLSQLAGINIHLDPRGLNQEGVNSGTPVTLNLNKEISLESALNLILEPLHLSYVIKDDVLKITSEQLRDGEIYAVTYNVSDLVIPIPNFVPSSGIGLQGLINDAHAAAGYGQNGVSATGPAVLVNGRPGQGAAPADQVLAQQLGGGPAGGLSQGTVPVGGGPGGMGGGANADFDSLIDLIVSTVSTETWAENGGGEAEIRPFPTNLSLVISQTQAVHEEIADLLEQLRRLQDLQVTIEVRFIQLNDTFFERIGIDFDLNIEDRTLGAEDLVPGSAFEPAGRRSQTVGLIGGDPFPSFTSDLDIPFRQGSFGVAIPPPFGGFDPGSAANFGFAILSDIEAYFLIQAAQGDSRTNVLQAPKVTLFNGQQAFVADAIQRPFVVGVIPVVGEFVAAQQPVIIVLNEGTMMTIQAVVSDDRRYVRMTIVPFFTQIGDVDEFTFEGSTSSTNSSSSKDNDEDGKKEEDSKNDSTVRSGVTVQLPSFQFVSVVTTVSVPDGGTVLLGGIKRLSEGRNEFGVPLLSKVPYINRLFRNVAIGRETNSLMMMVTPRIIIQEEEEERLGIAVP
jgi:general secretion pathway protein D